MSFIRVNNQVACAAVREFLVTRSEDAWAVIEAAAAVALDRAVYRHVTDGRDDLRQILLMDIIEALPKFDPTRGAFCTWVTAVCRNRAMDYSKSAHIQRHCTQRQYCPTVTLSSLRHPFHDSDVGSDDWLPPELTVCENPSASMESREACDRMRAALWPLLSALERRVVEHYIGGASYAEIGLALGIGWKAVDNALGRAAAKARRAGTPSSLL